MKRPFHPDYSDKLNEKPGQPIIGPYGAHAITCLCDVCCTQRRVQIGHRATGPMATPRDPLAGTVDVPRWLLHKPSADKLPLPWTLQVESDVRRRKEGQP